MAPDLCEASSSSPPGGGGEGAHASHPEEGARSRTSRHWHQPRVPLVVPQAAMLHPPCVVWCVVCGVFRQCFSVTEFPVCEISIYEPLGFSTSGPQQPSRGALAEVGQQRADTPRG